MAIYLPDPEVLLRPVPDKLPHDDDFTRFVNGLMGVHERQQEAIRRLSEENAKLRARMEEYKARDSSPSRSTSAATIHRIRSKDPTSSNTPSNAARGRGARPAADAHKNEDAPTSDEQKEEDAPNNQTNKFEDVINVKPPEPGDEDAIGEGRSHQLEVSFRRESNATYSSSRTYSNESQAWPVPPLWESWEQRPDDPIQKLVTRSSVSRLLVIEDATGQAMTIVNRYYQGLILRPNSMTRLCWDFMSSVMVFYDVLSIPLMAISLEKSDIMGGGTGKFTELMDWVTTIFWTLDVPWSFLTGYHSEGVVEMRAHEIAKHYVKTWFGFDMLLITIDWTIVWMSIMAGRGAHMLGLFRVGKSVRMARILRTVRLLRFVKLQRALSEMLELINSEYIRAVFNVTLAVTFIFVINHYLACGWFLVGHLSRWNDLTNWIEQNRIETTSVSYAYFTSLHWSLTQFTPASMEIRPFNLPERIYSICCLLFALITFSSFLGSITASISALRKHSTEIGKQQHVLRSYLTKNQVSPRLSKHIWNFLKQHHFSQITRSHKAQIEVLKLLPPHLQGMLHQELYGPYITRAPFFYHYAAFSNDGIIEVCSKGVTERTLICNEVLFYEGKIAEKMFFAASGYLKYQHWTVRLNQTIGTGAWLAEPVLWVKWVHVAPLIADTSSEIIELDAAHFRIAMDHVKHSLPFVKVYAQLFYEYLLSLGDGNMSDLMTDVHALETVSREAWVAVTTQRDRSHFRDMPNMEFPRMSTRQKRVKSLMWPPPGTQRAADAVKKGAKRLSTGVWAT